MGLLNHLFESTESIAKEIEKDDEAIIKHWKSYHDTVSKKKELIDNLHLDDTLQNSLQELKKLLELEVLDISNEEKEESELISDLEIVEHSKKIKNIHKLEQCLGYAETKYEYVYKLLQQVYSILTYQMQLIIQLQAGPKDGEKLISHLKSQLELEVEILNKIAKIDTFHNLFSALVKGEHIIKTMDSQEKKLLQRMRDGISKIFSNEITEGITYEWAMGVFNAIEDKVHELVANDFLDQHPDMDFEFANRAIFVDLVKEIIQDIRPRKVSEQMINVFVHLFREWYNNRE